MARSFFLKTLLSEIQHNIFTHPIKYYISTVYPLHWKDPCAAHTLFKKELIAQWQGVWFADNLSRLIPSGLLVSWKGHTLLEMAPADDCARPSHFHLPQISSNEQPLLWTPDELMVWQLFPPSCFSPFCFNKCYSLINLLHLSLLLGICFWPSWWTSAHATSEQLGRLVQTEHTHVTSTLRRF